jgi:hypothetical protein
MLEDLIYRQARSGCSLSLLHPREQGINIGFAGEFDHLASQVLLK